jgi:hypothetical protein
MNILLPLNIGINVEIVELEKILCNIGKSRVTVNHFQERKGDSGNVAQWHSTCLTCRRA